MSASNSSAASFIDQIKDEYRQVVAAEGSALPHAIKCGEYLTLAKENLKAERGGKWSDWLKTNCPDISPETANLYTRLAKHKGEIKKAKSIREARDLLPKNPKPRGRQTTSAAVDPPEGKPKPKLKDELEVLAADEVRDILVEAWDGDDEKLAELAKLIGDHLQKKSVTPLQNSPSPPSSLRRPVPLAQPSPTDMRAGG